MSENSVVNNAAPSAESASGGQSEGEDGQSSPSQSMTGQNVLPVMRNAALRPTLRQRLGSLIGGFVGDPSAVAQAMTSQLPETATLAEQNMFQNVLSLRQLRVGDVMVPRAEIEAVDITMSLGELIDNFERCAHSRMPVYVGSLDDPRGMIHIQDVMAHLCRAARPADAKSGEGASGGNGESNGVYQPLQLANVDLSRPIGELDLMRPLLFVPPSMLAVDLMSRMQANRIQMALVIDEYGGTDGLVSLEDIVEMVVGDIEDEHDDDAPLIQQVNEGVYIVDARAEIDDVAAAIGADFADSAEAEEVDTIGGLIFTSLGRIPVRGEVVRAVPGYEFHVIDADPRRVKRVKISHGRVADRRRRVAGKPAEIENSPIAS